MSQKINCKTKQTVAFSIDGILFGLRQMIPIGIFVIPFGLAFGVAAIEQGLSSAQAIIMSILVFSGAAQFAVLELWKEPLSFVALALTIFAVSSRHILLGAALSPWLRHLPFSHRLFSLSLLSDPNFAFSNRAFQQGRRDAGILVGGGLVLWGTWVIGTFLGVVTGSSLGSLDRFGIDVVMAAYFTSLLLGNAPKRQSILPYLGVVLVAFIGWYYIPLGWNILLAALVGGLIGVTTYEQ